PLHVTALNSLSAPQARERNNVVFKHLSAMMPFVGDVDPADLVLLREREEESFILFRKALTVAVQALGAEQHKFSSEKARELYSDVLEPGLAVLDRRVKLAKRGLRGMIRSAGAKIATLSFGMLPGVNPSAAGALGLLQVAGEKMLDGRAASEAAVRAEDLYFLWRVRQQVK
ncbi:MAG TPA: hypothetical protein VFT45_10160, partial [Longimicrobium sp.]|nr:hypothetical protein [Longimicrobium sp.]